VRTGRSTGLGKATGQITVWVPEETREGLAALATVAGMTMSEFVRERLIETVHGRLTLLRLRQGEGRRSLEKVSE
jgi:hypothetical protein